jgi:hypothetical protein
MTDYEILRRYTFIICIIYIMKCLYNNNNNKYILCVRRSLYDEKLTRACAVIVL